MLFIEAVNLTKEKIDTQIIIGFTKKIIKKLRQKKGFPFLKNIDLSIAFIGEAEIKKLNSKYRKINKPTDELSFLLAKTKTKLSGEILFCPKVIKTKDYGFHNPNYKLKAISCVASSPTPFSTFADMIIRRIKIGERWRVWQHD